MQKLSENKYNLLDIYLEYLDLENDFEKELGLTKK